MGRIIILTGKGGVGKSSVAAAHALRSAQEGKRTLLVSTDMAHNLGDIFRCQVGGKETKLGEQLFALELDPEEILRREFPEAARALTKLFLGSSVAEAEGELFMLPGFENLFSLLSIARLYREGRYERIIVDCAPTGETLSLLKLPELLSWYMEKFFPVGKTMVRVMSPISKLRYKVELPNRDAMDEIGRLHQELVALQALLKDGEICTVRLVCTPEKMVVEESKRSYMYLNLYRYQVDGVFINRVLPPAEDNAFLGTWHEIQQRYLEELHRVFAGLPIREIPWYPEDLRGEEAIARMAEDLLAGEEDFFSVRCQVENEEYEKIDGGWRLRLRLPGAGEEDLSVACYDLDLDVAVGNQLRRIPLPDVLRGARMGKAEIVNGVLCVDFQMADGEGREGATEA